MPKIVIKDVPGLDGEYELDLAFTHRDFRTIKQLTGVRANEVMDALEAGDLDIIVAIAEIALQRAGKQHSVEQLWDAQAGSLVLDVEDMEAEASPPPSADVPRNEEDSPSSGLSTNGDTEPSPVMLRPGSFGTPLPAAISDQPTSTN